MKEDQMQVERLEQALTQEERDHLFHHQNPDPDCRFCLRRRLKGGTGLEEPKT